MKAARKIPNCGIRTWRHPRPGVPFTCEAFYQRGSEYEYHKGWNLYALLALVLGIAPSIAGFLTAVGVVSNAPAFLVEIYNYAWFVSAFTSGILYNLFMRLRSEPARHPAKADP